MSSLPSCLNTNICATLVLNSVKSRAHSSDRHIGTDDRNKRPEQKVDVGPFLAFLKGKEGGEKFLSAKPLPPATATQRKSVGSLRHRKPTGVNG